MKYLFNVLHNGGIRQASNTAVFAAMRPSTVAAAGGKFGKIRAEGEGKV